MEPSTPEEEGWGIRPRSHRKGLVVLAVAVVAIFAVGAVSSAVAPSVRALLGPAPVWHTFGGVVNGSGEELAEGCSIQDLETPLGGVGGGYLGPNSVVVCSFHGASYSGYYGTDCDSESTGPIPTIEGALVPFGSCELSLAPLQRMFQDIFVLGGSNASLRVYSNGAVVANITTTGKWASYHCSMPWNNVTKASGPLACLSMGVLYTSASVTVDCNLGTPIQVSGVPVPPGSCYLSRSDVVSG